MFRYICLLVLIAQVFADVAPGRNQYLPPPPGYNYDKPSVGFPTGNNPQIVPFPQPPVRPPPQPPVRPPPQPPIRPPQPPPQPPIRPPQPPIRPPQPPVRPPQPPVRPPIQPPHEHHEDHHHHEPGMPFDFAYSVNDQPTSNDYSHKATSDGDVTRGEYRVHLPDGRVQIVRYTADWKNGYNAEVSYEGTPTYPSGPFGQASSNVGYNY